MDVRRSFRALLVCAFVLSLGAGCDSPSTRVVVDNAYPASTEHPLVIDRAFWLAVAFPTPIPPGASSDPEDTVAASPNPAYAVVASPTGPVVLQSRQGFEVHWNTTLHIPVDDTTFAGNCAAGSFLSQAQADFITGRVFASDFAGRHYDAATCTTDGP